MEGKLLSAEEVWGENALEVMQNKELRRSSLSDLAILLGGLQKKASPYLGLEDRLCGYYWTESLPNPNLTGSCATTVHSDSEETSVGIGVRCVSVRPALSALETSKIPLRHIRAGQGFYGAKTVLYGEFPQSIAENHRELERLYQAKNLHTTGKVYRFDSTDLRDFDTPYQERECREYIHNGKRYIRLRAKIYDTTNVLSNGKKPMTDGIYWVKVEPVEWIKDGTGVWVTKQALLAGMQFDHQKKYNGNFQKTDMYKRVMEFIKEIEPHDEYNYIKHFISEGQREPLRSADEEKKEAQRKAFEEKKRRILEKKERDEKLKALEELKGETRIEVGKDVQDEKVVKIKDKPVKQIRNDRGLSH